MAIDICVAAHASQYGLHKKYKPEQVYSPDTFVDPKVFLAAIESLEAFFLKQLAKKQSTQ